MKSMFLRSCLAALISVVTMSSLATAQLSPEQITSTNKILQQVKATIDKLPASHRQMLRRVREHSPSGGCLAGLWDAPRRPSLRSSSKFGRNRSGKGDCSRFRSFYGYGLLRLRRIYPEHNVDRAVRRQRSCRLQRFGQRV